MNMKIKTFLILDWLVLFLMVDLAYSPAPWQQINVHGNSVTAIVIAIWLHIWSKCYKTFYGRNLRILVMIWMCWSLAIFSSLEYRLQVKQAPIHMKHLLGAPLKGRLLGPYSQHLILFVTYEMAH